MLWDKNRCSMSWVYILERQSRLTHFWVSRQERHKTYRHCNKIKLQRANLHFKVLSSACSRTFSTKSRARSVFQIPGDQHPIALHAQGCWNGFCSFPFALLPAQPEEEVTALDIQMKTFEPLCMIIALDITFKYYMKRLKDNWKISSLILACMTLMRKLRGGRLDSDKSLVILRCLSCCMLAAKVVQSHPAVFGRF